MPATAHPTPLRPAHHSGGGSLQTLDLVIISGPTETTDDRGHASGLRALIRSLTSRGHAVLAMEHGAAREGVRSGPVHPRQCGRVFYESPDELRERWAERVREADAVLVVSSAPDCVETGHWINDVVEGTTVYLDTDTPLTLSRLEAREVDAVDPALIPRFDLFLSSTGGPTLRTLEERYGSPAARAFHCIVDTRQLRPCQSTERWHLAFLGGGADDLPGLERMLLEPARKAPHLSACVAGSGCRIPTPLPSNVEYIEALSPQERTGFYGGQRYALSVTSDRTLRTGWSPEPRLLEAAARGVPVISDTWEGLPYFFFPGEEVLLAEKGDDVLRIIQDTPLSEARRIGRRARLRVLARHTEEHRTRELEQHLAEVRAKRTSSDRPTHRGSAARGHANRRQGGHA